MPEKKSSVMIAAGIVITLGAALSTLLAFPDQIDSVVHTESEAAAEHDEISNELSGLMLAAEQTQAGFNAYTLNQLLQQELRILELQIEAEGDAEKKELLKEELKHKREFIRKLKEEERRQLLKKGEV